MASASTRTVLSDIATIDYETIPFGFKCSITGELMKDPVFCNDGNTYERSAIEYWFYVQNKNTSPLTREIITDKTLRPNRKLKEAIEEFIEQSRKTKANPSTTKLSQLPIASLSMNTPSSATPLLSTATPLLSTATPLLSTATPILTSSASITGSIFRYNGESELNINILIPETASSSPPTIIFAVDISGSMDDNVSTGQKKHESDIFTKLNLVQHSLNTIYSSLPPGSKIAIITFNAVADIILPITEISSSSTAIIKSKIANLQADGGTNIWAGLLTSLQLVEHLPTENNHILLFTDGEANYNPPRGLVPTFKQFYNYDKCRIHTFAYGSSVNSDDLSEIATIAKGIFGYIPDGTMVGTIFINAISNILSLASSNVHFVAKFANSPNSITYKIGSVLYNQAHNYTYDYDPSNRLEYLELHYNGIIIRQTEFQYDIDEVSAICLLARRDIIHLITAMLANPKDLNPTTKLLRDFIIKYQPYSDVSPFISDLLMDCEHTDANKGQIGKSIDNFHWFNEWGCHYLRSLIRAYQLEMCLNFKDSAPLHFAGSVFKKHQLAIEKIFNTITPPIPKKAIPTTASAQSHTSAPIHASAPATLPSTYYDNRGGCFTGGWNVLLPDGGYKPVSNVCKGDVIKSNDSPTGYATVICVVKLMIVKKMCMISPDGGKNGITAYHPLWIASLPICSSFTHRKWIFPESMTDDFITVNTGEYMYDFITDKGFSVCLMSNNSPYQFNVACLGHNCNDNAVIQHEYFGTQAVINDLKIHSGWSNGNITLDKWEFLREPSGRVIKLIF